MMKHKNSFNIYISWLLVILWMAVIFYMSSQPAEASDGMSKGVTKTIIQVVNIVYPLDIETSTLQVWIDHFNHNVRKLGHVTEYLILGIFVANAYKKSGVRGCKLLLYSFILCFTYAISDELHQYFVPGRGPSWGDVLIDSAGAILGIGVSMYGKIRKCFNKIMRRF